VVGVLGLNLISIDIDILTINSVPLQHNSRVAATFEI